LIEERSHLKCNYAFVGSANVTHDWSITMLTLIHLIVGKRYRARERDGECRWWEGKTRALLFASRTAIRVGTYSLIRLVGALTIE
jgi:hypothetical protein